VKVDGIESTEGLNLGDNNRQFYKDGLIEVRVGDLSRVSSYSIPYSGEEYKSYLKPSSLIQSENQEIIERTKEIVKGEKDSIRVVRKINDWVYNNLEKVATLSIPNALDVLETRKGDCNEHSTLFAALARAAGIPTKIVLGVVFLEEKFYYHAWDEVFVGSWIAVDPTLGQVPADASHIKFIEGDLSKTFEIIKVVGNIKLEIKDAS
jgi:transglutaminase-like putative cysteine protease